MKAICRSSLSGSHASSLSRKATKRVLARSRPRLRAAATPCHDGRRRSLILVSFVANHLTISGVRSSDASSITINVQSLKRWSRTDWMALPIVDAAFFAGMTIVTVRSVMVVGLQHVRDMAAVEGYIMVVEIRLVFLVPQFPRGLARILDLVPCKPGEPGVQRLLALGDRPAGRKRFDLAPRRGPGGGQHAASQHEMLEIFVRRRIGVIGNGQIIHPDRHMHPRHQVKPGIGTHRPMI